MPQPDITLYHSPRSRSYTAYWMLEELNEPFAVEIIDIAKGDQKQSEYLAINPSGKVPAIDDGSVVVTESPAICIYLADKYAYGDLAPAIDAVERGAYLKWMVYSTAVIEPAVAMHVNGLETSAFSMGWGDFETMVSVLTVALTDREYIVGGKFTAADVMIGSTLSALLFRKHIPNVDALVAYDERMSARPACQRAQAATWG